MKNDVSALAGSSPRAIDTMPLACGVALNSGSRVVIRLRCSSVRGVPRLGTKPVWMTNPRATRWNAMPS